MTLNEKPSLETQATRPDSHRGLSAQEADRLLDQFGFNEPAPVKRRGWAVQFLLLFANPLVVILLTTSAISALVGDASSAGIIIAIVLVGAVIDFIQTYRSQTAVERLREGVALTATTLRDGAWIEVPRREIVPGDVIRLTAGDLVPADAQLSEARDLHVQEAALTGESMPAEKEVAGPHPGRSASAAGPQRSAIRQSISRYIRGERNWNCACLEDGCRH